MDKPTRIIDRDAEVHYSVIDAIANGEVRWQKISRRVGKKSASLSRPLDWLGEMDVVEHVAPITEYPDPSPKSMVYRLLVVERWAGRGRRGGARSRR